MKLQRTQWAAILSLAVVLSLLAYLIPGPAAAPERSPPSASIDETLVIDPATTPLELDERDPFYLILHVARVSGDTPSSLEALEETLDFIEPGGAAGHVRVGFIVGVSLYTLFEETEQGWRINSSDLQGQLAFAARSKRPVVVYIKGDHFAHSSALFEELAENRDNLLALRDGSTPDETYFVSKLNAGTLSVDPSLEIVQRRAEALREVGKVIASFQAEQPELLRGVLLNGETHHLFTNFFAGTGATTDVQFTDYSPASLAGFDKYLAARGSNRQGESIASVDFNQFDGGEIEIEGWVDKVTGPPLLNADDRFAQHRVNIYINGQQVDSTLTRLNRLDVYQALPDSHNPNIGFSYAWDYSAAAAGEYGLQAVLAIGDQEYEIGRSQVEIEVASGKPAAKIAPRFASFRPLGKANYKGYLDSPREGAVARYDELARLWLAYRSQQIVDQVNFMGDTLRDSGVDPALLYTYQLTPWLTGRWNADLFGVGEDFFRQVRYQPGVTTYGGNTLNPALLDYLPSDRPYAVPEWHPQLDRSPMAPLASLKFHYDNGATFLSPYYFEFKPDWQKRQQQTAHLADAHSRMLLTPTNARMGSRYAYDAVVRFAAY